MPDRTTQALATYANLKWSDLSPKAVNASKDRLLDSIGCAAGGFASRPASIARNLANYVCGCPPASIWFSGRRTSPDMAAYANATMVRYLDWNDTITLQTGGHPSDMIPVLVATAEAAAASGRQLMVAIVAAYEAFGTLAGTISIRERGWDQGLFIGLGAAVGLANLMNLSPEETANGLALTVTPSVPTRQTRAGQLSMWKACATAAATRSALFAMQLASHGLTGPDQAFEGRHGVLELVTGPLTIPVFRTGTTASVVEKTHIKCFPSEFHSQAPIWLALELRRKVPIDEIERIEIATYWVAYSEIGSEPEKWRPTTRETADHSLPFLIATALRDGDVSQESFSDQNIADADLRRLIDRIHIREDKTLTSQYPAELATRIKIVSKEGQEFCVQATHPKGHAAAPLTEDELVQKFRRASARLLSREQQDGIIEAVRRLDKLEDISKFTERLIVSALTVENRNSDAKPLDPK